MDYTRQETLEKCQKALIDIKTFYKTSMVNYRGKTSDTKEYYTEIIAEFICNHIELFRTTISVTTRESSYKTASHIGVFSESSNRIEELTAMKMFNQSKEGHIYNSIGEIIDYQTPLKSTRKDVAGKVDLLAYDGSILRILELKKPDSEETMLRCVLEGYTYMKTANSEKMISNFTLPQDTIIKASPLVFLGGIQHKEMKEDRQWLRQLMILLDSVPFYISIESGKYIVKEG
ncbi:MAG: hypothetical protein RBR71_09845 [Gudongella sp.]|nr:hypothetical protein [Gudongella sp.]